MTGNYMFTNNLGRNSYYINQKRKDRYFRTEQMYIIVIKNLKVICNLKKNDNVIYKIIIQFKILNAILYKVSS